LKAKGLVTDTANELWIAAGFTYSQKVAEEGNKSKQVFSEQESDRLPEHKLYDHTIDLKLDAPETLWSKVYPMLVNEQEELDHFLEENLQKGYVPKGTPRGPIFRFPDEVMHGYGLFTPGAQGTSPLWRYFCFHMFL
jgi:hypothetical protein